MLEDVLPVQVAETLPSIMDPLPKSPTHFQKENRRMPPRLHQERGKGKERELGNFGTSRS